MSNASGTTKTTRWDRAPELPPEIFAAWRKPDGALSPVAIVAAPNIAVSMRGRARVVQERMETNRNRAIVEIEIAEVKNDMVPTLVVENGITISAREEHRERFQSLAAEVERMPHIGSDDGGTRWVIRSLTKPWPT